MPRTISRQPVPQIVPEPAEFKHIILLFAPLDRVSALNRHQQGRAVRGLSLDELRLPQERLVGHAVPTRIFRQVYVSVITKRSLQLGQFEIVNRIVRYLYPKRLNGRHVPVLSSPDKIVVIYIEIV